MAAKKTTSTTDSPKAMVNPASPSSESSTDAEQSPLKKAQSEVPPKKSMESEESTAKQPEATVNTALAPKKSQSLKKSPPLKESPTPKKSAPLKKVTAAKDTAPADQTATVAKSTKSATEKPKSQKPGKSESPATKTSLSEPAKTTPSAAAKSSSHAKAPAAKSKSSLIDFPVPPAPVRPPFVPPKSTPAVGSEPVAAGSNGSHSPAFVQKQRQRLLDLRDDLVDAMSGMTRDTIRNAPEGSEASGSGQHQGDAGSDAYDRDFALSVLAKEQDALYEIEQALRRIQSGSYGICEISSRKIPQARLEAIPFARLTVECQAQWEKEYGKRRFRPSNEVGFSGGNYIEDEDSDSVSLDEDED